MAQKAVLDNKSLENINLDKVPKADHATYANYTDTIREIRYTDRDIHELVENFSNIHKSNNNDELNIFRCYAENYSQYHLPCVDSHILVFSIDKGNTAASILNQRLIAFDLRSNNIYSCLHQQSIWTDWVSLVLNDNKVVAKDNLAIWLNGTGTEQKGASTSTVSAFNGTIVNSTIRNNTYKVYDFNGSSQYLQLTSLPYNYGNCSFSLWFMRRSFPTWSRMFDWGSTSGTSWGYLMCNSSTNSDIYISIRNSSGSASELAPISTSVANTWYHVVITINQNILKFYLNGILTATQTLNANHTTMTLPYMFIARSNWPADSYYNGQITDFRFYNKVLDSNEVNSIYNIGPVQ